KENARNKRSHFLLPFGTLGADLWCPLVRHLLSQEDRLASLTARPPPPDTALQSRESSCSVSTGQELYSDAPASIHFPRSPFIALAATAIMGSFLQLARLRIARI